MLNVVQNYYCLKEFEFFLKTMMIFKDDNNLTLSKWYLLTSRSSLHINQNLPKMPKIVFWVIFL